MNKLLADVPLSGEITGINDSYNPGTGGGISGYGSALEKIISNALTIITIFGGLFFVIYFLIGGVSWVTAGGDEGKVEKAKKMMTNSATGLIIIGFSYALTWIVGRVVGIDLLEPSKILQNSLKF